MSDEVTSQDEQPATPTQDAPADVPAAQAEADETDATEADTADTVDSGDSGDSGDPGDQEAAGAGSAGEASRLSRVERLEQEGDIAADYLEELLDIADLDGDLDMDVDGDRAAVSIVGADLSQLVGRNGEVLDALQELTRLAVYRETGERSRLMLDISGHRANRRAELVALAEKSIADVKATGERLALEPMTSFERKVVHDAVSAAGLTSESEGAEPKRRVVILPE